MKKNIKNKLARSYAEALYEAAATPEEQDVLLSDMNRLASALQEDENILKYLGNPLWKLADKQSVLKEIATVLKLGQPAANCLNLMAENNRLPELRQMAEDYAKIYYDRRHIAEVEVFSAIELSNSQQHRLEDSLQKLLMQKIAVSYVIKPEILGGLLIRFGSKMIDDSVAGKLNRLELLMKGK